MYSLRAVKIAACIVNIRTGSGIKLPEIEGKLHWFGRGSSTPKVFRKKK